MERNRDRNRNQAPREKEFLEKLIKLNRVSKTVKGGRRMSFSALVVVGDKKGRVGYGMGKANDVSDAIRKATEKAKGSLISVNLKGSTIPHEVTGKFKSASVFLKPASAGTGVIAGGPVRAVCDAVGLNDILSKSLGSKNVNNIVKATFDGLENLFDAKQVATNRGKKLKDMWG